MKKLFILGIAFALFTSAASAQRITDGVRKERTERSFDKGQLTRGEKFKMEKNHFRYKHAKHRAKKDGRYSRKERKHLSHMKRHDRREMFRYKHNGHRRS